MSTSVTDIVLQSMRERCIYRPTDVAAETNLTPDQARQALRLLARGGGS